MSVIGISDAEFESLGDITPEFMEDELRLDNESLRIKLLEVTCENKLNRDALQLLISICKKEGFDPFPGEDFPFKKAIKDLTPIELLKKNREATARIETTRHVKSSESIPQPGYDETMELYKKKNEYGNVDLVLSAINNGGVLSFEEFDALCKKYNLKQ